MFFAAITAEQGNSEGLRSCRITVTYDSLPKRTEVDGGGILSFLTVFDADETREDVFGKHRREQI